METTSRLPGLYTPSPSHARKDMYSAYFDSAPRPPFATGAAAAAAADQLTETDHHETRKRGRDGTHNTTTSTPHGAASSWGSKILASARLADAKSPPPLAHDRYELARGGIDQSPHLSRQSGDYDDYLQLQKQRGNWSVPPTPLGGAVAPPAVDAMTTTPNGSKSWTIMGLVGGVAGKLIEFCSVPFRGFQAGNGIKYNLDGQEAIATKLGLQDDPAVYQFTGAVQNVASVEFPPDNYGVRSVESVQDEHSRTTKRLRTADNWVVVGTNGETESQPCTPRLAERRIPEKHTSPSQIPRPVSRAGAVTPSKRPSLIPVSRRSTMDRKSFLSSSHTRQRPLSRQSYGSLATFDEAASNKPKSPLPKSPLPKESQRLINKVRREELEEDARLRRMSSQMSAMLREAKEALGSTFEVQNYYGEDETMEDDNTQTWFS